MNLTQVLSSVNKFNGKVSAWSKKSNTPKVQLVRIECLVLLSFIMLAALFPIQYIRRRKYRPFLKGFGLVIYTAITFLIPYIYGLMLSLELEHALVPTWAVFLLFLYASVPISLKDRTIPGIIFMKFFVYSLYVLLVIFKMNASLFTPFMALFILLEAKVVWRTVPLVIGADRTDYPFKSDFSTVSMCTDDIPALHRDSDDPLMGCKYAVDCNGIRLMGNKVVNLGEIITIGKIWSFEDGSMLSSPKIDQELKSTCLSFSLYRLLLHKFVGIPSYESSHLDEAWNLIRNGLLDPTRRIGKHLCPFRVIQVELGFLHDYFFSPSNQVQFNRRNLFPLILKLSFFGVISWVSTVSFSNYHHRSLKDNLVTGILILVTVLLELVHLIASFISRSTKKNVLCAYLRRAESGKGKSKWDCYIKKAAQILCQVRPRHDKHRERELGQYSLLHSCSYLQQVSSTDGSPDTQDGLFNTLSGSIFSRPGRKQSNPIPLSQPISDALIKSLRDQGRHLTDGVASLMKACGDLSQDAKMKLFGCCTQPNAHVRVVLICHIATSACEIGPGAHDLDPSQSTSFQLATSLSKYCAYLVAFVPDLLPGDASITDHICNMAIKDAYSLLIDCEPSSSITYEMLMKVARDFPQSNKYADHVLQQGAFLAMILNTQIEDANRRWEALADFWVEMMLYLAPNSTNHWAHAEKLQDGGEFITLLWALLFHAGIEDQSSPSINTGDNASARTSSA